MNKVAYCLLAIFLGGIGIQLFYSGRIGAGIASILFCWTFIPMIVGVVQFFIALFKQADENGMIYRQKHLTHCAYSKTDIMMFSNEKILEQW